MSKKRYIDTSFWSDVWVVDELNPLDRYLFLYFLTNDKTNIAGVYEISLRTISYETGIEREELLRMLKRLESRVVYHDGYIIIRKAIKNQNYKNTKIEAGIDSVLQLCPPFVFAYMDLPLDLKNYASLMDKSSRAMDESSMSHGRYSDSDFDSNSDVSTSTNNSLAVDEPAKPKVNQRERTKQIDAMFLYWENKVGYSITGKVKQNREYAGKLLNEYESTDIAEAIHTAARMSEDRFATRVANFIDLYRKWDDLKHWDKKQVRSTRGVTQI